ncbi:MAG: glycosyltransferase family 4 protein [Patescibacteria group bacterium]|nr:glycosyltransferase family 4 protein [Patescibacteria group bacterium]
MNILITRFPYQSALGGEEMHTLHLFEDLQKTYNIQPVFLGSCKVFLKEFQKRGWKSYKLSAGKMTVTPKEMIKNILLFPWYKYKIMKKIQEIENTHSISAIYIHSFNEKAWLGSFFEKFQKPIVWVEHQELGRRWFESNPFRSLYVKNSRYAHVICNNDKDIQCLKKIGVEAHKIENSIDFDLIDSITRQKKDPNTAPFTIGCTGRLVPDKGFLDIVNANKQHTVHIIGEGEMKETLKTYPNIEILPFSTNYPQYLENLQKFDIYIAASRVYETFGVAPLEAIACKIPVIINHNYGIGQHLTEEMVYFCETSNTEALQKTIEQIINNPRETQEKSEKAYAFAKERWDKTNMNTQYWKLLNTKKDIS